jgi:hypothetical protein
MFAWQKPCGKQRLTPEQLLATIHTQELADWFLHSNRSLLACSPAGIPSPHLALSFFN